jgi:RND family efflux transporter MFP subunit
MSHRLLQIGLPILLLVFAAFGAKMLTGKRGALKERPKTEVKQTVEVYHPEVFDRRFSIDLLGKTTPSREVSLQAEVTGLATKVHADMVPGGLVKEGDLLVEMEKTDYQLAIRQAQSQVEQARVRVQEEEGRQVVAQKEWSLIGEQLPTTERGRALALREPQMRSALASLKAAQSGLGRAQLALKRTMIRAPMNAVVLREGVEVGQRLGPGYGMVTLAGTDAWWVQVSVPQRVLQFVESDDVQVTVHARGDSKGLTARVARRLADLDPVGKMVRLIVEVDDPMRLNTPGERLFLNDTVDVKFHCLAPNVTALPRKALRSKHRLWTADAAQNLAITPADIYYKNDMFILVRGLSPKTIVVTSSLTMPTPGTALKWTKPKTLTAPSTPAAPSPKDSSKKTATERGTP